MLGPVFVSNTTSSTEYDESEYTTGGKYTTEGVHHWGKKWNKISIQ